MPLHPFIHHLRTAFSDSTLPVIDMYEMDNKSHTFGYWKNREGLFNRPGYCGLPDKILILPIIDGNYPGNPEALAIWDFFMDCLDNPSLFTLEEYNKRLS